MLVSGWPAEKMALLSVFPAEIEMTVMVKQKE
jgi:hypothetical protein